MQVTIHRQGKGQRLGKARLTGKARQGKARITGKARLAAKARQD
jgi:hypothetical protein